MTSLAVCLFAQSVHIQPTKHTLHVANSHISFVSLLNISNCIWDHQKINIFLKENYYILHSFVIPLLLSCVVFLVKKGKGKAVLLQAWSGPEGSRKLR